MLLSSVPRRRPFPFSPCPLEGSLIGSQLGRQGGGRAPYRFCWGVSPECRCNVRRGILQGCILGVSGIIGLVGEGDVSMTYEVMLMADPCWYGSLS